MNQQLNRDLLPCPFCGGDATLQDLGMSASPEFGPSEQWWLAGCENCGLWLPNIDTAPTKAQAIEAWNRRLPERPPNDPIETGPSSQQTLTS